MLIYYYYIYLWLSKLHDNLQLCIYRAVVGNRLSFRGIKNRLQFRVTHVTPSIWGPPTYINIICSGPSRPYEQFITILGYLSLYRPVNRRPGLRSYEPTGPPNSQSGLCLPMAWAGTYIFFPNDQPEPPPLAVTMMMILQVPTTIQYPLKVSCSYVAGSQVHTCSEWRGV